MDSSILLAIILVITLFGYVLISQKKPSDQSTSTSSTSLNTDWVCKKNINMNTHSYSKDTKQFSVELIEVEDCTNSTEGWTRDNICKNYQQTCNGQIEIGNINSEGTKCIINECEPCDPVFEMDNLYTLNEVDNLYDNTLKRCPSRGVSRDEVCRSESQNCADGIDRVGSAVGDACTFNCDFCTDAYSVDADGSLGFVPGHPAIPGQSCLIVPNSSTYFPTKESACSSISKYPCYVNGLLEIRRGTYMEDTDKCEIVCNECALFGNRECFEHNAATGEYTSESYSVGAECSFVAADGSTMDPNNCKTRAEVLTGGNAVELCPARYSLNTALDNYDIQTKSYSVPLEITYDANRSATTDGFACSVNNAAEVCASYTKSCIDEVGVSELKNGTWDFVNNKCVITDCYLEASNANCEVGQDAFLFAECNATCGGGQEVWNSCRDSSQSFTTVCNNHDCPQGCTGSKIFADIDSAAGACSKYCGGSGIITAAHCSGDTSLDVVTACGTLACPEGCGTGDREFSEWSEPPRHQLGAYQLTRTSCGSGLRETGWRFVPGWRPIQLTIRMDHQFVVRIYFPAVSSPGLYDNIADIVREEQATIDAYMSKILNISFQYSVPNEGAVPWETPFYSHQATMSSLSTMGSGLGVQYDATKNLAAYFEISSKDLPSFDFTRNVHDNYTYRVTCRVDHLETLSNEHLMNLNHLDTIPCEGVWSTCVNGLQMFTQTVERFPSEHNKWEYVNRGGFPPRTTGAFPLGGACGHRTNARKACGNSGVQIDVGTLDTNTPYALKMVNFKTVFDLSPLQNIQYTRNVFQQNVNSSVSLEDLLQSNMFLSPSEGGMDFKPTLDGVDRSVTLIPAAGEPGWYYMYIRELEMYLRLDRTIHNKGLWQTVQYLTREATIVDAYQDLYKFNLINRSYVSVDSVLTNAFVLGTKTNPQLMVSFMIDRAGLFLAAVQNTTYALMFVFFRMVGDTAGTTRVLTAHQPRCVGGSCAPCEYLPWSGCIQNACDDGVEVHMNTEASNRERTCTGDLFEIRSCNSCADIAPEPLPGCMYQFQLSTYDDAQREYNTTFTRNGNCSHESERSFAEQNACGRLTLNCNGIDVHGSLGGVENICTVKCVT
jgi:hypothetical protein